MCQKEVRTVLSHYLDLGVQLLSTESSFVINNVAKLEVTYSDLGRPAALAVDRKGVCKKFPARLPTCNLKATARMSAVDAVMCKEMADRAQDID